VIGGGSHELSILFLEGPHARSASHLFNQGDQFVALTLAGLLSHDRRVNLLLRGRVLAEFVAQQA
jgi:hypothetical protein